MPFLRLSSRLQALALTATLSLALLPLAPEQQVVSAQNNQPLTYYRAVDLGPGITVGGPYVSFARDVNSSGQVVGYSQDRTFPYPIHAITWLNGESTVLPSLQTSPSSTATSRAFGINDNGDIVGHSVGPQSPAFRAVAWKNGEIQDLHALLEAADFFSDFGGELQPTTATDINELGQIIGNAQVNQYSKGFVITDDHVTTHPIPAGFTTSHFTDINNTGQVVGSCSEFVPGPGFVRTRGFIWSGTTAAEVGTFGGTFSVIAAINDHGTAVGEATTTEGFNHALIYENGTLADVHPADARYSSLEDINNQGVAIGTVSMPTQGGLITYPAVYDGGFRKLQDLIQPGFPLVLRSAIGISDSGHIACIAYSPSNPNLEHAVLLTPVKDVSVAITSPASGSIYPVGTSVAFTGSLTTDVGGIHSATWTFQSNSEMISLPATIGAPSPAGEDREVSSVSDTYTFTTSGVYLVTLSAQDAEGNSGSANTVSPGGLTAMIVIYDPDGGSVTGGGWISSPYGAYAADPNLSGWASFGFTAKYRPGATIPSGSTEFRYHAAGFNFRSTSYDWLVVSGARAQYKGFGTVNGSGEYRFILTAVDGELNGRQGYDRLRLKVWNPATDAVIYDNQMGAEDGADPSLLIGDGQIIIRR